jgi:hypothetical protein
VGAVRTISLAVVCGLVAALAAAVAASAQPGTSKEAATSLRPATSLPYRNGFRGVDDVAGDHQSDPRSGDGAADITRLTISNDRAGAVTFAITVNQNSLFVGDFVIIFLDLDRSQSTGCAGDEALLQSVGRGAAAPLFELYQCRNGQFAAVTHPSYVGTFDAPDRRVLFRLSRAALGVNRFNALAMTVWVPDDQNSFRDFAPDGGQYLTYTLQPIPCNELLRPQGEVSYDIYATPQGRRFAYRRMGVENIPAGAVVTIRIGRASATVRANSRGIAVTRRFRGRFIAPRTVVVIRVSAEGCVLTARFRVLGSGRLRRI